jgi:hypothetical protein
MSEHHTPAEIVGHEQSDAELGPLVRFAIFLAAIVGLSALLVVGLYKYLDAREIAEKTGRYPLAEGVTRPPPPRPRLQTYPFDDIKALRKEENKVLDHYAWVDQNAGVVRIPIERAIDVLAEKGLPYRQPGQTGQAGPAGQAGQMGPGDSVTPERAKGPAAEKH